MNIYTIYSGDGYTCCGIWVLTHEQVIDIESLYKEQGEGDTQAFVDWLVKEKGFIIPETIDLYTD